MTGTWSVEEEYIVHATGRESDAPMKRVLTVADKMFDVVIFISPDGSGEAIISAPLSTVPTRVQIETPPAGMRTAIRYSGGATEVWYE